MDRLLWIRRPATGTGTGTAVAAVPHWWPAVYCSSHNQVMREFPVRLEHCSKMQTALMILQEQRTHVNQPILVRLTGAGTVRLVPVPATGVDVNTDTVQWEFMAHLWEYRVTEDNWQQLFGGDESLHEEYLCCLSELETLLTQEVERNAAADVAIVAHVADTTAATTTSTSTSTLNDSTNIENKRSNVGVSKETPPTQSAVQHDTPRMDYPAQAEQDDYPSNDDQETDDDQEVDNNEDKEEGHVDDLPSIPEINARDPWDTVWAEMQQAGWHFMTGGKPYKYIKPGRNSRPAESQEGQDYFTTLADLQQFAQDNYGWVGPHHGQRNGAPKVPNQNEEINSDTDTRTARTVVSRSTVGITTPNQKTKPQDPGAPLYSEADDASCSSDSDISSDADRYHPWAPFWKELQHSFGWRVVKARNPLHDWYYIRPGRDVDTGEPGVDYFLSTADVIAYHQKEDEKDAAQRRKRKASANDDSHHKSKTSRVSKAFKAAENSKVVKTAKTAGRAASISVKTAKASGSSKVAKTTKGSDSSKIVKTTKAAGAQTKKRAAVETSTNNEDKRPRIAKKEKEYNAKHWWKTEAVPSFQDSWPALLKLGYYKSEEGYHLPKNICENAKQDIVFKSSKGLRMFLCGGIPNYDKAKLQIQENTSLDRWVKFANVPVTKRDSVSKLAPIRSPQKDKEIKNMLVLDHNFQCGDGRYYIPFVSDEMDARLYGRKEGKHYFREENVTELRCYIRGCWGLGSKDLESAAGLTTPPKQRDATASHKLLQLRLWAAASSAELPKFSGLPTDREKDKGKKEEMQILQAVDEEEEEQTLESDSESVASTDSEASEVASEVEEATIVPVSPMKETEAAKVSKKPKRDKRPFYLKEPMPSFKNQIWPTLQHFGFKWGGSGYAHSSIAFGKGFDNASSLRKYLCSNGIPDYDNKKKAVDKDDRTLLNWWLCFTHVPVSEINSMSELATVKLLPDAKYISWLVEKLGFASMDNKYFPPGADSLEGCRIKRIRGTHFYQGVEEIRAFIRSHESFNIGNVDSVDRPTRKVRKAPVLATDEVMSLRLWAALSDAPIPTFVPLTVKSEKDETRVGNKLSKARSIDTDVHPGEDTEGTIVHPEEEPAAQPGEDAEATKDTESTVVHPEQESGVQPSEEAEVPGGTESIDARAEQESNAQAVLEHANAVLADANNSGTEDNESEDMLEDATKVQVRETISSCADEYTEAISIRVPNSKEHETDHSQVHPPVATTEDEIEVDTETDEPSREPSPAVAMATDTSSKEETRKADMETYASVQDDDFAVELEEDQDGQEDATNGFGMAIMTQPSWDDYSKAEEDEDPVRSPGSFKSDLFEVMEDALVESVEKRIHHNDTHRISCGPHDSNVLFCTQAEADEEEDDDDVDDNKSGLSSVYHDAVTHNVTDSLGRVDADRHSAVKPTSKLSHSEKATVGRSTRVSLAPSEAGLYTFSTNQEDL